MLRAKPLFDEKLVHLAFQISLIIKGIFAFSEIVSGIAVYFISQRLLVDIVTAVTQNELSEDPRDVVANYLLHQAQQFSVSTQHFTAIYLCSHGLVKLWLIVGLLRERLWYYPTAIIVFVLFITYQLYRFSFTHSIMLVFLTLLDVVVIGLTWHEYRYLARRVPRA